MRKRRRWTAARFISFLGLVFCHIASTANRRDVNLNAALSFTDTKKTNATRINTERDYRQSKHNILTHNIGLN